MGKECQVVVMSDSNSTALAFVDEEVVPEDAQASDAVRKAEYRGDGMHTFNEESTRFYMKHGDLFRDREESDFFFMLPLDSKRRMQLLATLVAEKKQE
jgi:hypothetical protein